LQLNPKSCIAYVKKKKKKKQKYQTSPKDQQVNCFDRRAKENLKEARGGKE
jgi:hypothetical protein